MVLFPQVFAELVSPIEFLTAALAVATNGWQAPLLLPLLLAAIVTPGTGIPGRFYRHPVEAFVTPPPPDVHGVRGPRGPPFFVFCLASPG